MTTNDARLVPSKLETMSELLPSDARSSTLQATQTPADSSPALEPVAPSRDIVNSSTSGFISTGVSSPAQSSSTMTMEPPTATTEIPGSARVDVMVHKMNDMKKTVTGVTVTAVILALVIIGYITYRLHSKFFIRRSPNPRHIPVTTDEEQPATPLEPYTYNSLNPGPNMREVDPPSVDTRDRDGDSRPNRSTGALEFMGIDPFADDDSLRRASRTSSLPSYGS